MSIPLRFATSITNLISSKLFQGDRQNINEIGTSSLNISSVGLVFSAWEMPDCGGTDIRCEDSQ